MKKKLEDACLILIVSLNLLLAYAYWTKCLEVREMQDVIAAHSTAIEDMSNECQRELVDQMESFLGDEKP